jgi:Ca2+-binding EF-hand superfamily protein
MVQIMAKPSVQKLMQDPAMARMMQDPLAIEQQIAQLREAANGDKLSQEDGNKVREMLSMQLGVSADKVDEFLADLDDQPVDDRTREVLRLFKAMLTGEKVEQPAAPAIDLAQAQASCEELFRLVDRDGDGFINFEELAWLARETGGYVNEDVFEQQCALVGADAAHGLTKDQLLASYVEFGAGDIAVDLATMRVAAAGGAQGAQ